VTTCCWIPLPTWIVSPVAVIWLPVGSLIETDSCTVWPCVEGGRLKFSCPLNVVPPSTDCSTVLTEPKLMFDVESYAFPVA